MVNRLFQDFIVSAHGEDAWNHIRQQAGVDEEHFLGNEAYPDEITFPLAAAASVALETPVPKLRHAFGLHCILTTTSRHYGWGGASSGANLREFLIQLPNFHDRFQIMFPRFLPTSFTGSDLQADSLIIRYSSHRRGLAPFAVGLLDGLGQYHQTPVRISQLTQYCVSGSGDSFLVTWL